MSATGGVDGSLDRQYGTTHRLERRSAFWAPPAQGESPHERVIAELRDCGARTVLEVGAGTGQFAATVATELGIHVLATDASAGMVQAASRQGVESRRADVMDLPFEDGAFDAVMALWMLYHVADLDRALAEIRRVMVVGGTFVAVTNGREHLRTLLADAGVEPFEFSFSVENGAELLGRHFDHVTAVPFSGRAEADHATAQAYLRTFLDDADLPVYDGVKTYRGAGALFIAR